MRYLFVFVLFVFSACGSSVQDNKAREIIDQSIKAHGGEHYDNMNVSFTFRQFRVHLQNDHGKYLYERTFTDSTGNTVHDVLTNEGFERFVNNTKKDLDEKDEKKYHEGLNAIAYFALLPFKLSEPAVNLQYAGDTAFNNNAYHKVLVTFNQQGGGQDHEENFCYWINQSTNLVDYLAYTSGGPRFRKAVKRDTIAGLIFQDYENYQLQDTTLPVQYYDKAFLTGKATLLSNIQHTHYTVD